MPMAKAYPGDTYIEDLAKASKAGRPWVKIFLLALILAFFADLQFLSDTVGYALSSELGSFIVLKYIIGAALVVIYLFVSVAFGKKLKEYLTFKKVTSLIAMIIALCFLIFSLVSLMVFRIPAEVSKNLITSTNNNEIQAVSDLESELANTNTPTNNNNNDDALEISPSSSTSSSKAKEVTVFDVITDPIGIISNDDPAYIDAVSSVFVMTLIMLLSAFLGAFYAFYNEDTVASKIYRKSLASIHKDRQLYNQVFFNRACTPEKDNEYEQREREIDKQVVDSVLRISNITTQLNGIVDAADAHDFLEVQKLINKNGQ